jgi:cytochrome c-type biogenesis protein
MTLLIISFVAGILTVLSPCVLPLLPVIVGGSLAGGTSYRRALTVTLSLGVSVFVFTFLLKVSTVFIMVPPSFWNWLSGGILFLVGIFFVFPNLWDLIPGTARANRDSTQLMSKGFMRQNFWGDVLVGAALGPVFTTCSPTYFMVLASVLPGEPRARHDRHSRVHSRALRVLTAHLVCRSTNSRPFEVSPPTGAAG